jgi:hydrogenase-4 component B
LTLLLAGFSVLFISAIILLLTSRAQIINACIFLSALLLSGVLVSISAINNLITKINIEWQAPFTLPVGNFALGIDSLSAFFLLMIVLVFSASGIYAYGYFKTSAQRKTGAHYAFYQLLLLSLLIIVTARDAVLFLIAWELMTLCGYFLIMYYDEKVSVRGAGYLYLIATHSGTFFLGAMFLLLGQYAGSFSFNQMANIALPGHISGIIFALALIGFGVKAGTMPMHIWLPHAHPAAPSHISAVFSGVVIKTGIYGLLRIILIVKHFPDWCAAAVVVIGVVSGIGGVLYALGQHEIKKLLAYHSIENIGIIMLGIGMGLWGQSCQLSSVSIMGYAGALLHVFNHAVFKGLLFLSAGSVIRCAHTGEIDQLGGLLKLLPWTGNLFLIGSLSICGLPLFNGFISEWFVYQSLFGGLARGAMGIFILHSLAIASLALIGGLAAACFVKVFAAIFLGTRREHKPDPLKPELWIISLSMVMLATVCLWIGLFPRTMAHCSLWVAGSLYGTALAPAEEFLVIAPFQDIITWLLILIGIIIILSGLKLYALRKLPVARAKTWGCGYRAPSSRMQYTAASFAQPLMYIFRNLLGYKTRGTTVEGYFPVENEAASQVIESSETYLFKPLFRFIEFFSEKLKCIQYGYTQLYLLYFLIFLLTLLIWKMN